MAGAGGAAADADRRALSVAVYLVTCASYKTYFLVPMVGVVAGASLTIARRAR